MLMLTAITSIAVAPDSNRVWARATVRIYRSVRLTPTDWKSAPARQKREVVIDENGEKLTIRLIEFE